MDSRVETDTDNLITDPAYQLNIKQPNRTHLQLWPKGYIHLNLT